MSDTFHNRAHMERNDDQSLKTTGYPSCDNCADPLIFALKDRHHEFSLGLFSVLECLKLAEKEGYVPELPEDWWHKLWKSYDREF